MYLDVRTKEEYDSGHFPDALHHDLALLMQGIMPPLEKNIEIKVYCRSGNRSETARKILSESGFTNVTNIGGYTN
ncbi:MAG: phage shock protein [Patescibacteria group bacterium]|jgi:phage shock protein E|nr:phage shock protein [Patescibacteria group bacterium]